MRRSFPVDSRTATTSGVAREAGTGWVKGCRWRTKRRTSPCLISPLVTCCAFAAAAAAAADDDDAYDDDDDDGNVLMTMLMVVARAVIIIVERLSSAS